MNKQSAGYFSLNGKPSHSEANQVYVSITGLRLKSRFNAPRFWWHAFRSMRQALKAEGNISASTRSISGVHHTLSVWRDKEALRSYLLAGAHREAMRAFPNIATGKTFGFWTQSIPEWSEVHAIWAEHGKPVQIPNESV